jgi:diguanylate cyclase (GGDEF)-like protein
METETPSRILSNILKTPVLRNLLITSLVVTALFPLYSMFYIIPSFDRQLTENAEDQAIRTASNLRDLIIKEKTELTKVSFSPEEISEIKRLTKNFHLEKLKIFSRQGEILFSTTAKDIGEMNTYDYFQNIVAKGNVYTKVVQRNTKSLEDQVVTADVVETYVPLLSNGSFIGAFEIYYDITDRKEKQGRLLIRIYTVLLAIILLFLITVFVIFFKASNNILERNRAERSLRESEERYRELSIVDDLTQLYNSRHFYVQLKSEIDRSNRYEQPLTLLLLDLDDFKAFNDTYGHVEGDQVLMRLGRLVKKCLRQTDSAYRYGGEEFTILLPVTRNSDGVVIAERIRMEFKKEHFSPAAGKDVNMTVSVGIGQYKPQEEMKTFVHRVDQLMYQGKKNGKDRACSES